MKNNLLKLALALLIMGSTAVGCSSSRETSGNSDSTMIDSSATTMPPDTTRMDTTPSGGADTIRTDSTTM